MATTSTTLSVAIGANDTNLIVAAATGATVDGILRIDDEYMVISAISGTVITVRSRGAYGTLAASHNATAPVVFGLASDVVRPAVGRQTGQTESGRFAVVTYAASGAIAVPTENTLVVLNGAAATAMTLANPSPLNDGVMLIIVAATAYNPSHTVTLATGYLGSSASDVFTFTASSTGVSITLVSYKGVWAHVSTALIADESVGAAVA